MDRQARLDEAIARFLQLRERGAAPDIHTFAADSADLRDDLLSLLSTLEELEAMRGTRADSHIARFGDAEYEVLTPLGRGGMGEVHLAADRATGKRYALKSLLGSAANNIEQRSRFEREAMIGMRLRHPNIVRVLGRGMWNGLPCLLMDYVEGVDLNMAIASLRLEPPPSPRNCDLTVVVAKCLERRPTFTTGMAAPSVRDALHGYYGTVARIGVALADALQYAHEQHIVHRDIKPQNVLLDRDLNPHILDFGLAHEVGQNGLSHSGDQIGTLHYMSPEMVRLGARQVDHRTDIYSLGVTLFELLTFSLPFSGPSSKALMHNIENAPTPWPRRRNPDVPADLQGILLHALEKRPERRYQTAAEMADDLRRFLRGEPVSSPTPSKLSVAGRWVNRHRKFVGGMGTALVLAIGGPAVLAHERNARWNELVATGEAALKAGDREGALKAFAEAFGLRQDAGLSNFFFRLTVGSLELKGVPPGAGVEVRSLHSGFFMRPDAAALAKGLSLPNDEYIVTVDGGSAGFAEVYAAIGEGNGPVVVPKLRPTSEVVAESNMALIPQGAYPLGHDDQRFVTPLLPPPFKAKLSSYYLDRREVSNRDYARYMADTGAPQPRDWKDGSCPLNEDDFPVAGVSWDEARSYAEWAGKRLPTGDEWEAAARGKEGQKYPNGTEWVEGHARLGTTLEKARVSTGAYLVANPKEWRPWSAHEYGGERGDISPFGILNMTGNVSEWVLDAGWNIGRVPSFPTGVRIVRGNSYMSIDNAGANLAAQRIEMRATQRSPDIGFRCAKSAR